MKAVFLRSTDQDDHLSKFAARSHQAQRLVDEAPCPFRSPFQRDRDRIIHSKAFRRLAHKTQVFIATSGDHHRTRLTHTLEVSQIARTLSRVLGLNEDLTEAIALGHDLGHTPFGHAGERVLNELSPNGFRHQDQSLRIVDVLSHGGHGLNLTNQVRNGILKHSKGYGPIFVSGSESPSTYEGQLVRAADIIAYLAHDLDDAIQAGIVSVNSIPSSLMERFGANASCRINSMVIDLLNNTDQSHELLSISFSKPMEESMVELRRFLNEKVYLNPTINLQLNYGKSVISFIYSTLMSDDHLYRTLAFHELAESREQAICDFISGMTDRYALEFVENLSKQNP
ncbi:MAG: deoxyguanosinetriphosphate triphosphohydrolase [Deltaproteobacteria bacterium]|nr:deoxyguanosinetriphosphate triphosphohydrolase [Deltaproteobacteria bacterium]